MNYRSQRHHGIIICGASDLAGHTVVILLAAYQPKDVTIETGVSAGYLPKRPHLELLDLYGIANHSLLDLTTKEIELCEYKNPYEKLFKELELRKHADVIKATEFLEIFASTPLECPNSLRGITPLACKPQTITWSGFAKNTRARSDFILTPSQRGFSFVVN